MFDAIGKIRPHIQYRFWAGLGHEGQTLADLISKMESLGNEVIAVDEANQQVLIAHWDGGTHWGCRFCLEAGKIVLTDSEAELNAHAQEVHGWKG